MLKVCVVFLSGMAFGDVLDYERILYLVVLILVLSLLFYQWFKAYRVKRIQLKRLDRGRRLEQEARQFLVKKGFRIVGEQVEIVHDYEVDGEPQSSVIVLDYLVAKRGKTYIVEVKSGNSAISVQNGATRRQILEYDFVFKNDGVYLLDMENRKMHLVRFFPKSMPSRHHWFFVLLLLAFVGTWLPDVGVKGVVSILLLLILVFYKKIIQ